MHEVPLGMGIPAPLGREPLVVAGRFGDHLAAHEYEHRRKAVVEEPEEVHHAGQQEVERPQAEDREDVGREGDESHVVGARRDHAENRRHAVDREQDVGALDDEQHEKQRRGQELAVLADEEPVARLLLGDGDEPAEEADHRVLARFVVAVAEGELDARVDEEAPKQPHHPLVTLDQLGPEEHEREPHDHGAEDAPEEHAILILQRHAEVGEHHREHEDVVHRQRPLDEVAGQKLDRRLAAEPPPDEAVEGEGQGRPENRPKGALAERRLVRLLVKDGQVEHQHHGHEDREGDPVIDRDLACEGGSGVGEQKHWRVREGRGRPGGNGPTSDEMVAIWTPCGPPNPPHPPGPHVGYAIFSKKSSGTPRATYGLLPRVVDPRSAPAGSRTLGMRRSGVATFAPDHLRGTAVFPRPTGMAGLSRRRHPASQRRPRRRSLSSLRQTRARSRPTRGPRPGR